MEVLLHTAGFGVKLGWPGEKQPKRDEKELTVAGDDVPPKGHTMTFVNSLQTLLHTVAWVIIFPQFILCK